MEADQNDQLDALALEEQVAREVDLAYIRHGYMLGDGQPDKHAVEDKVYTLVSAAVVEKRPDRGKVAITKRRLMSSVFGQVPGPEAWLEQEDADLAKDVYKRLDGHLWRLVGTDAGGKIQKRLNSDIGMILCKTKATPDEVEAVYVTKDLNCLLADFSTPQRDKLKKEADRFATNLAMAIDRLPVHASRFKNELNGGMKTALGSASAILQPALEAAAADQSESEDGEDE